jgi:hypothetical protein
MSPKSTVLAIYPEAYMRKVEHSFGDGKQYYAIFISRVPKGAQTGYRKLLGAAYSPKGAWHDAMREITKNMMEKLES